MTTTNNQIAATILRQLGGNRFVAMTGAKQLVNTGTGLWFTVGKNAKKVKRVLIDLEANDTYTIRFGKISKHEFVELSSATGIYADSLCAVFEAHTGLYTSL